MFLGHGFQKKVGDEAFYLQQDGKIHYGVLTINDDFHLAHTEGIVKMILEGVFRQMAVFKVDKDKFLYTGLDVHSLEDGNLHGRLYE